MVLIHLAIVITIIVVIGPVFLQVLGVFAMIAVTPVMVISSIIAPQSKLQSNPRPIAKPRADKDVLNDWKCILSCFGALIISLSLLWGYLAWH